MKVNIVDQICGSGKTSAAINYINSCDDSKKILYITPYLDEVNRIIESCPKKNFVQPQERWSKMQDIKRLLRSGRNIVSTHALFSMFDQDIINTVYMQNYILIMDEVADVVEPLDIKHKDLELLLEKTTIDDSGCLEWIDKDYNGDILIQYKKLVDLKAVYYYSNTAILWCFPVECFKAFRDIYILTYMFDCQVQRYYYDMFGIEYNYLYIKGDSLKTYEFTDKKEESTADIKYGSLVKIVQNEKMNRFGDAGTALCKNWYMGITDNNRDYNALNVIKNCMNNYFKHITKTPTGRNMWTTFEQFKKPLAGKGYAKSFVPCNARATNAFMDRTALAYMVNRYFNPILKNFFLDRKVRVEEDQYALSELIQWMFRSSLRRKNEIQMYIPSVRMRKLLEAWLVDH